MQATAGSLDPNSLVIPLSRWRVVLLSSASIAVAAFGTFATLVLDHTNSVLDHVVGWSITAAFAIVGVLGLWLVVPGRRRGVRLSPGGFTILGQFASPSYAWSQVERFKIVRFGLANTMVGVDLKWGAASEPIRRTGRMLSGADLLLPPNLKIKPQKLLDLMEEWRRRYSAD